jgi:hypothetical protein
LIAVTGFCDEGNCPAIPQEGGIRAEDQLEPSEQRLFIRQSVNPYVRQTVYLRQNPGAWRFEAREIQILGSNFVYDFDVSVLAVSSAIKSTAC